MAGGGSPTKAILYAFSANFGIAVCKLVAWFYTSSSSMLAETIHSFADTVNQLLLLFGMHRAKKPADADHPLGYGKATYFWSFIVAVLLFSIGGLFSVYEGWHKLHATEPVERVWIALTVLGIGIVLEGGSMFGCVTEINKFRRGAGLWRWLNETRRAELVVIFGEDFAALVGLTIAFGFLSLASITGDPVYDAYGSISIGVLLLVVSLFIAWRVRALLIGTSAAPDMVVAIDEFIAGDDAVDTVYNTITLQIGPQIMFAAKLRLHGNLPVNEACEKVNSLERRLRETFPEIGWSFVELDIAD